jgi:hypothetical protein
MMLHCVEGKPKMQDCEKKSKKQLNHLSRMVPMLLNLNVKIIFQVGHSLFAWLDQEACALSKLCCIAMQTAQGSSSPAIRGRS